MIRNYSYKGVATTFVLFMSFVILLRRQSTNGQSIRSIRNHSRARARTRPLRTRDRKLSLFERFKLRPAMLTTPDVAARVSSDSHAAGRKLRSRERCNKMYTSEFIEHRTRSRGIPADGPPRLCKLLLPLDYYPSFGIPGEQPRDSAALQLSREFTDGARTSHNGQPPSVLSTREKESQYTHTHPEKTLSEGETMKGREREGQGSVRFIHILERNFIKRVYE